MRICSHCFRFTATPAHINTHSRCGSQAPSSFWGWQNAPLIIPIAEEVTSALCVSLLIPKSCQQMQGWWLKAFLHKEKILLATASIMIQAPGSYKHMCTFQPFLVYCLSDLALIHRCKTEFGPLMPRSISHCCSSDHLGTVSILYFKRMFHYNYLVLSRYGI